MMDKELLRKINAELVRLRDEKQFWSDGVLDEEGFAAARPKILWILKEPHARKGWDGKVEGDFRVWMRDNLIEYLRWRQTYGPIVRVSYALLHGLDDFAAVPEAGAVWQETMRRIAYLNVKKTAGGARATPASISRAFKEYGDLLVRQVEAIAPDIIFNCAYGAANVRQALDDGGIRHAARVAHLYHPAQTRLGAKAYFDDALAKAR
jgi:hypothetical protein